MAEKPKLEFLASRQLTAWMAEHTVSFAVSTYQVGKLFFFGLKPDGTLEVFNRTFNRAMGLAADAQTLYLSTLYQLWRFENSLLPGQTYQDYDRVYVPQVAYTTGDVDVHDIAVGADGRPVLTSTLFSCLATVSERYSFEPVWKPPFISRLAAEDRCHLNGFCMVDGRPKYATSVSRSDVGDGWRDHRNAGGVVIDIDSGDVVLDDLSMPHSPRWYRDRLWLLDSGNGWFGYADTEHGRFERVAFCPGYGRGLSFAGDFAIVGLSQPRSNSSFADLALSRALEERKATARCGVQVIDLRSGDAVHFLRLGGMIEELYDVAAIAGVRRPMAIGLQTDEIRRVLTLPPE